MRTVFATALLAYGTDARNAVISAELVFICHANILTVEVLCEVPIRVEPGIHDSGGGGHPITVGRGRDNHC